jgi:hypothetical protein
MATPPGSGDGAGRVIPTASVLALGHSPRPRKQQMGTKQKVQALLDRLPDDCRLEDVLYHLYVLHSVEQGREEAAGGETIPHDEVADELRRKWQLGAE